MNPLVSQLPAASLNPDFWDALHGIKSVKVYPRGTILFEQGSPIDGIYVVDSGQVRVLLPTGVGRPQLLDVAGPGTILGLSETLSGDCHRVTAEAGDHTTVSFIPRTRFMEFIQTRNDYCIQVVRLLSEDLHSLYHKFRSVSTHPGRPRQRQPDQRLN